MNTELGVRREAVQWNMTDSVDYENSGGMGVFSQWILECPFQKTPPQLSH